MKPLTRINQARSQRLSCKAHEKRASSENRDMQRGKERETHRSQADDGATEYEKVQHDDHERHYCLIFISATTRSCVFA